MGVLVGLLTVVTPNASMLSSRVHALSLVQPGAMVAAPNGGLYIYDTSRHQVLLREPNGNMRVVAGNGVVGQSGDGGPATRAALGQVVALALAPDGTLYLSGGNRVRAVCLPARSPPSWAMADLPRRSQMAPSNAPKNSRTARSRPHAAIGSPGIAVSPLPPVPDRTPVLERRRGLARSSPLPRASSCELPRG